MTNVPRKLSWRERLHRWRLNRKQPRWNRKPLYVTERGLAVYPAALRNDPTGHPVAAPSPPLERAVDETGVGEQP